jgi:hypothetical protein
MKTLTTTIIILALSFGAFSCKSTSQAKSTTETIPNGDKKNPSEKTDQKDMTYDMIISFISKASGIDSKVKTSVDTALETFNKTNKTDIKPEIVHWGREGELDYNFVLKNLSTKQKKAFIGSMKEVVGSSDMAQFTFDQKSVHKR